MFEPIEEQQQWELESQLGRSIDCLLSARERVQKVEKALSRARKEEARQLARVRDCRQRLGVADTPIPLLVDQPAESGSR